MLYLVHKPTGIIINEIEKEENITTFLSVYMVGDLLVCELEGNRTTLKVESRLFDTIAEVVYIYFTDL